MMLDTIKKIVENVMATKSLSTILIGTVVSVEPLSIKISDKLTITSEFIMLTDNVRDYYQQMTIEHNTEIEGEHLHKEHDGPYTVIDPKQDHLHEYKGRKTWLVHNALEVGEKVYLNRLTGGQSYLVVSRVDARELTSWEVE